MGALLRERESRATRAGFLQQNPVSLLLPALREGKMNPLLLQSHRQVAHVEDLRRPPHREEDRSATT